MCHSRLILLAAEEFLQCLESAADLFLRDLGQGEDLTKGTADTALATSNEDASCDNGFLGLPFESLSVIDDLEQVLREVGSSLGDMDSVAVRTDLLVGGQKVLGALVMGRLVLRALEIATAARRIAKGNGSGELRTVEQRVRAVSDTRGVVAALVVIRERAPLGACVDNAIAKDETTVAADHVAGGELLDQVRWEDLAVLADHLHVEVLDVRVLSLAGGRKRGRHFGLEGVFLDVDVPGFPQDTLRRNSRFWECFLLLRNQKSLSDVLCGGRAKPPRR